MAAMNPFTFQPIGQIRSCFTQKFGIPRQPGLVPEATAVLEIHPPFHDPEGFRGLEGFSHIWILFVFHACASAKRRTTVRPPRLGGNRRLGIFATRSGFRPNPIGQSVVEMTGLEARRDMFVLYLKGIDLLDRTPVLDIKPYLPYADCLPRAAAGYARQPPATAPVIFSEQAAQACRQLESQYPELRRLIGALLAQDPRPAYRSADAAEYGMQLWDLNVRFKMLPDCIAVQSVGPCAGPASPCQTHPGGE